MTKKLVVLCEGPSDRAILNELIGLSVLPSTLSVTVGGPTAAGLSGIAAALSQRISVGERVLAIRDRDLHRSSEDAAAELVAMCAQTGVAVTALGGTGVLSGRTFEGSGPNGVVRIGVCVAGLPSHPLMQRFGVSSHAIDDHLFAILCADDAFDALTRPEKNVTCDHARCVAKLEEVRDLFVQNKLPLVSSKRFLHVACAIIGYRASPAQFASDLVRRSATLQSAQTVLDPLIQDILAQVAWLSGP